MFNLIVKDPQQWPPERAVLDRVRDQIARPRTCCAVFARTF